MKIGTISGFPEYLPEVQITFQKYIDTIRKQFERFGFSPIETPAVERTDVLLSKGVETKEIYGLRRLSVNALEEDSKDLALHFDLTVPLARYVAQHYRNLVFPFRRYQIQPVWRGERPQKGRFRQFYQCDIDVIGNGRLSLRHDAEMPAVIYHIFRDLNIGHFVIRVNNRKVMNGMLRSVGLTSDDAVIQSSRTIDKIAKIGVDNTIKELVEIGVSRVDSAKLVEFFQENLSSDLWLTRMKNTSINSLYEEGVNELEEVINSLRSLRVPDDYFIVDPIIARGLGYYTGTVYETSLTGQPQLGSICSGGRYDNLAAYFAPERTLPGVGISIGLTRLFAGLMDASLTTSTKRTNALVLVTTQEQKRWDDYLRIASILRERFNTELYLEEDDLAKQLKYGNSKGFPIAIIAGHGEFYANNVIIKHMNSGAQQVVPIEMMLNKVAAILESEKLGVVTQGKVLETN